MKKIGLLFLLFLGIEIHSFAQKIKSSHDNDCAKIRQVVQANINEERIVYYFFGIVPTKISKETKEKLKVDYHLSILQLGCSINSEITCNNRFVNEHFVWKYGKSVNDLINELEKK